MEGFEALTGAFDAHHGELARIMLDQIDALTRQIDQLTTRIDELIAAIPTAQAPATDNNDADGPATRALPTVQRLAEIPGIGQSGSNGTPPSSPLAGGPFWAENRAGRPLTPFAP